MVCMTLIAIVLQAGPTAPLVGAVVDDAGAPVVGAELILTGSKIGAAPVVARVQSGEGGRFRLDRPADLSATNPYVVPTLWAYVPGRRAAVMKYPGALPGADEAVRVVLGAPAKSEFRVEGPDGKPVAGARVNVQGIKGAPTMPEAISDLAERTTGPDGVATIEAFDDAVYVDVIAKGYGTQPRRFDDAPAGPRRVVLIKPAGLKGRLVPDGGDASLSRGWKVRAWTYEDGDAPGARRMVGYGETNIGDDGRFDLPELVPGSLSLSLITPDGLDALPEIPRAPVVHPDKENTLEIPIRRASRIVGKVVEHGTGKPVSGMQVHLFRPGASQGADSTTDADGHFSFLSLAGKARIWGPTVPEGYVSAGGIKNDDIPVPEGGARVEAGTYELLRAAAPLKGEVRDEAGRPVAGAAVQARWSASSAIGKLSYSAQATSDDRGAFTLAGLAPKARVEITARGRGLATNEPTVADVGAAGPVVVTVLPRPMVAVAGRVLGPGGVPIAGANVRITEREVRPGLTAAPRQVYSSGMGQLRTGPDGAFRSAQELDREHRAYQVDINAPGYESGRTAMIEAGEGDVLTFPDVTLRRILATRIVTGRVVDRENKPVAGATVFHAWDGPRRTQATTDDGGGFRLAGIYAGPALVFAEAEGFRFGGAVVGEGPVEVRLARVGEPPIVALKTLPPTMTRAEERALGRELIEPVLAEARHGTLENAVAQVIPALARLDPDRVEEMIEDRVVGQPAAALAAVMLARFEDDPGRAVATIEADGDPASRGFGFLALADAVPASDARRREFLDRALAEARRADAGGAKAELLGQIADRWLDLGDVARATPVLRDGQAAIAATPGNRFSYQDETFAEVLAAVDLPAARAIFERKGQPNVSPPSKDEVRRHLGKALTRIAAVDPAEAERLLPEASGGPNLDDHDDLTFRVAVAMGRADPERAKRLLGAVGKDPKRDPVFSRPGLAPYGLGLIAARRADVDPAGARAMLDEAFAGLVAIARRGNSHSGPGESALMASLLPAVERLDPERLPERLWLAASCRTPRPQEIQLHDVSRMAALALLVSRYDPAMAAAIVAPALDRLPALLDRTSHFGGNDTQLFGLLAAQDVRIVESLIRALPAAARKTERVRDGWTIVSSEALARLAAAEALGRPPEERRRAALRFAFSGIQVGPESR
ncbi:MSCRAMM family protein [Tundrisphaera sp. TA3]|uniref:MSCRAMM family protein n=1 Tax=Tundrisphaera sp. TA3 TaxID=3435775 RepID=UPI003EBA3198